MRHREALFSEKWWVSTAGEAPLRRVVTVRRRDAHRCTDTSDGNGRTIGCCTVPQALGPSGTSMLSSCTVVFDSYPTVEERSLNVKNVQHPAAHGGILDSMFNTVLPSVDTPRRASTFPSDNIENQHRRRARICSRKGETVLK